MTNGFIHLALAIDAALFASIWEGALIVGAVWLLGRCVPSLGSASRYGIWLCTLVAIIAIPIVTALKPAATVDSNALPPAASRLPQASANVAQQPAPATHSLAPFAVAPQQLTASRQAPSAFTLERITVPQTLVLAVALLWAIVTCGRLLRLALDFREIATIRRQGAAWCNAHGFPIYLSLRVNIPIAVGFLSPAVILPRSIIDELHEGALQAILIHETAHLRRFDVWTNAIAQILEALIALNPVSWFVARQIVTQREIACDDWVVAQTHCGEAFARALASMAAGVRGRFPAAAPRAIGSRQALVERIAQLMDVERPRCLRFSGAAMGSALAFLTLTGFTLQAVSPALALTPQKEPAGHVVAANAANCNYKANFEPFLRRTSGPGSTGMYVGSAPDGRLQKFAALHLPGMLTYQVAVDATGHPHNFVILHSSNDPRLDNAVERSVLEGTFSPAQHACVAVAATFRSGLIRLPRAILRSSAQRYRILPEPGGAPKTCAVSHRDPKIVSKEEPRFPAWLRQLADQRSFASIVKVHVDKSGRLTDAARYAVETPPDNAQTAFDNAVVAAAKHYTYAAGIRNCTPYASAYLIQTTLTKWLVP